MLAMGSWKCGMRCLKKCTNQTVVVSFRDVRGATNGLAAGFRLVNWYKDMACTSLSNKPQRSELIYIVEINQKSDSSGECVESRVVQGQ